MTNQTKIIIGVGAIALAYYFYTKRNSSVPTSNEKPSEPNSGGSKPPTPKLEGDMDCPKGQVRIQVNCIKAPCPSVCGEKPKSNPMSNQNTYRLKQDFSRRFPIGQSGSGGATYRKGQIIEASTNPYAKNRSLYTTYNGSLPNFNSEGQIWIEIPSDILEKV